MQACEKFNEYTSTVCDQIRWKKAHAVISEEIENHLIDQRDAYISGGEEEAAAIDHAIAQMGDPVLIGGQLDRTHRPKPQWRMLLLTAALLMAGLVIRLVVLSGGWYNPLPRHLFFMGVGLVMMAVAYFADFTLIGKYPKIFFIVITAVSLYVILSSPLKNGQSYYGGNMPILFPLAFAAIIVAMRGKGYLGLAVNGLAFALLSFLNWTVPTVSGMLLFAVCGLVLMLIAVAKNWFGIRKLYGYLTIAAIVILALVLVIAFGSPYIWQRFLVAFNPATDPEGAGFLSLTIRNALINSSFIGHSEIITTNSWNFIESPPATTTLLLTSLIYNVGWIGFVIVAAILLLFIYYGFVFCLRQKSGLGLFVSVSIMLTFTAQVLGYIIYNLGFAFSAPVSLPLLSYGNIAMVLNLALIGLLLSVFRTGDVVRDNMAVTGQHKRPGFIAWDDGKLIISLVRKH